MLTRSFNRCKESDFIDRMVYRSEDQISCPKGCGQKWCKRCQQRIEPGGVRHSCDGSSELQMLSKREGWKNCPGLNLSDTIGISRVDVFLLQAVMLSLRKRKVVTT